MKRILNILGTIFLTLLFIQGDSSATLGVTLTERAEEVIECETQILFSSIERYSGYTKAKPSFQKQSSGFNILPHPSPPQNFVFNDTPGTLPLRASSIGQVILLSVCRGSLPRVGYPSTCPKSASVYATI